MMEPQYDPATLNAIANAISDVQWTVLSTRYRMAEAILDALNRAALDPMSGIKHTDGTSLMPAAGTHMEGR